MTFEFKPERYDDGSGTGHWFSGIYKITKYDEILTGPCRRQAVYRAYFKPVGWKNWGNAVDRSVTFKDGYTTLEQAMNACERHAERFTNPHENDQL